MSRKDYQKHLEEGYFKTSIFYLCFFSLFYLIISFNIIRYNFWLILISYTLYLLAMVIILYLINRVFTYIILKLNDKVMDYPYGEYLCEINDEAFIQKINEKEYVLNWNDVKKIKQTKKYIMLFSKNSKSILVFRKDLFESFEQYDKLVELVKQNRSKHIEKKGVN
jgi:hypothetical protein